MQMTAAAHAFRRRRSHLHANPQRATSRPAKHGRGQSPAKAAHRRRIIKAISASPALEEAPAAGSAALRNKFPEIREEPFFISAACDWRGWLGRCRGVDRGTVGQLHL